MLRMISTIFSSSQAQPAVKSESEGEDEEQQNGASTQDSTDGMNGGEAHMAGLSNNADGNDTPTPIAHANKERKMRGKQQLNGSTKRAKANSALVPNKDLVRHSERQNEDEREDGNEEEEIYEDAIDAPSNDQVTDVDIASAGNTRGKGKSKRTKVSKVHGIRAPTSKPKASRKTHPNLRSVPDLGSDLENGGSSGPRTRSVSRALESAGEESVAEHAPNARRTRSASRALESAGEESAAEPAPAKASRARKPSTKTAAKAKRKAQPLPEIPEDDAGDEDESSAERASVKAIRARKSTTASAKPKGKTQQLLIEISQENTRVSSAKPVHVTTGRTRKTNIPTAPSTKKKSRPPPEIFEDHASDESQDDEIPIEQRLKNLKAQPGTIKPTHAAKQAELRSTRGARNTKSATEASELQGDSQVEEVDVPPTQNQKSKRKIKPILERSVDAAEDDENPASSTLEPNEWARKNISRKPRTRRDVAPEVVMTSSQPDREEDTTPIRPSKKALGKRKALDAATEPRKKQKTKNFPIDTPPLTNFGFTNHSDSLEARQNPSTTIQRLDEEELGETAATLLKESMMRGSSPDREDGGSQTTPSGRRATPKFTPINRRIQSRPQVLITSAPMPTAPESSEGEELTPVDDKESDSSSDGESTEPHVPKSNERRKRRLPVGGTISPILPNTPKSRPVIQPPKPPKSLTPVQRAKKNANSRIPKKLQGRFSDEIYEEIAQFIESWLSQKDMTQYEFNAMMHETGNRKKSFVNALCGQIPDAPRVKLVRAVQQKYHNFVARGTWTAEQNQELLEAYEQYGDLPNKWKKIGEVLNRNREDCRDRYRNYLVCGDKQVGGFWTQEEEDQLKDIIAEILDNIRELKSLAADPEEQKMEDEMLIDWNVVSARMGRTRSRLQCSEKWKQIKAREDPDGEDPAASAPIADTEWRLNEARKAACLMTPAEKLDLLRQIRATRAARESSIPWLMIQGTTNMQGERMTLKVCLRRLKLQVPGYETMMLQEIVTVLIDAFEAAAPHEPEAYANAMKTRESKAIKKLARGKKQPRGDDGEVPTQSKKRKSTALAPSKSKAIENEDNGEGPSNRKLVIAKAKKPGLIHNAAPVKKLKLRERMLQEDETSTPAKDGGDNVEELDKTPRSTKLKRIAKKPIVNARRSQQRAQPVHKSAERVTASDDEDEMETGLAEQSIPTPVSNLTESELFPQAEDELEQEPDSSGDEDLDNVIAELRTKPKSQEHAPPALLSSIPARKPHPYFKNDEQLGVWAVSAEEAAYARLGGNFRSLEQIYADEARAAKALEASQRVAVDSKEQSISVEEDQDNMDNDDDKDDDVAQSEAAEEDQEGLDFDDEQSGLVEVDQRSLDLDDQSAAEGYGNDLNLDERSGSAEEGRINGYAEEQAGLDGDIAFTSPDLHQRSRSPSVAPMEPDHEMDDYEIDEDDENELTKLTHDQASVDLDQADDEEVSFGIDRAEADFGGERYEASISHQDEASLVADDQEINYDEDSAHEDADEPMVNGIHQDEVDLDNSFNDDMEQSGLAADAPLPAERWDGYGDALKYNRDQSDHERTPVPGVQNPNDDADSSSSDVSTIYHPRFVVSSAVAPDPNSESSSEESSDEEEEELVEAYAEDDIDDDYEEKQPRRRTRASAPARYESVEL